MNRETRVRTPAPRSPQKDREYLIHERGFQKLMEKWDSVMDVVGKTESYSGKILTANKTELTVKGKAELIVQLEMFSPEFRVGFLISSVDIFDCLLGLDFLTELDCILYIERKNFFCVKNNKTLELKSSMQNTGTMFLIVSSTQVIPARSEKLLQCEVGTNKERV